MTFVLLLVDRVVKQVHRKSPAVSAEENWRSSDSLPYPAAERSFLDCDINCTLTYGHHHCNVWDDVHACSKQNQGQRKRIKVMPSSLLDLDVDQTLFAYKNGISSRLINHSEMPLLLG